MFSLIFGKKILMWNNADAVNCRKMLVVNHAGEQGRWSPNDMFVVGQHVAALMGQPLEMNKNSNNLADQMLFVLYTVYLYK